jgi:hypothetical protein
MNIRGPITVAEWSNAWTIFALSNTGIVRSNPTQGMDVCVRLFYVCVVLCVGSDLATGWSPVQGVLPIVYRIKKLKERPKSNKRTVDISWVFSTGGSVCSHLLMLVPLSRIFLPWKQRRCVPQKRRFTRRHIPEDGILHSHRCENLKSYMNIENYKYQNGYFCQRVYL